MSAGGDDWTKEALDAFLKKMRQQIEQSRSFVVYCYCYTYGMVSDTEVCGLSDCKSCRMLAEAIDVNMNKGLTRVEQERTA